MTNGEICKLKENRNSAIQISKKIDLISAKKQKLIIELLNIQRYCTHEIVVKYNTENLGAGITCLNCTKKIYGKVDAQEFIFSNVIEVQNLSMNEDTNSIILKMLEEETNLNPDLSDSQIVEHINQKINSQPEVLGPRLKLRNN